MVKNKLIYVVILVSLSHNLAASKLVVFNAVKKALETTMKKVNKQKIQESMLIGGFGVTTIGGFACACHAVGEVAQDLASDDPKKQAEASFKLFTYANRW